LSDHFNRPGIIEENNNLDDLMRGFTSQPQKNTDKYFDKEVSINWKCKIKYKNKLQLKINFELGI